MFAYSFKILLSAVPVLPHYRSPYFTFTFTFFIHTVVRKHEYPTGSFSFCRDHACFTYCCHFAVGTVITVRTGMGNQLFAAVLGLDLAFQLKELHRLMRRRFALWKYCISGVVGLTFIKI